jgi:hypothetical protein
VPEQTLCFEPRVRTLCTYVQRLVACAALSLLSEGIPERIACDLPREQRIDAGRQHDVNLTIAAADQDSSGRSQPG